MFDRELARDLHDLAGGQHGAAHRLQLLALGIPSSTIDGWVRQGRLLAPAPEVFTVPGAPPTWRQRVAVAALSCRGWASHRTAAALHNLDGFPPTTVEIVTERSMWRRRPDLIRHITKDLREIDDDVVDGIPTTSLVRTLIDLPAVCSPARAGLAWDAAIRRHGDDLLASVRARFLEVTRRGRNGTVIGRQLLAERTGEWLATDSAFESRFLRLVLGAGLPTPQTQVRVELIDGGLAFLDVGWIDAMVAAECDSLAHHFGHRKFQSDRTRRHALQQVGWDIYEYTFDDLVHRPERIIAELTRALRRSGRAETGFSA